MYGLLPSEVAARATTYDLMVTDILVTYENYELNKASGTQNVEEMYTENELVDILRKTNEQHR